MAISIRSLINNNVREVEQQHLSIEKILDKECLSINELLKEPATLEVKDEIWEKFLKDFDNKIKKISDSELIDYIVMIVFDDPVDRDPELLKGYYKKFGSIKKYLSQLDLHRWDYRFQLGVHNY